MRPGTSPIEETVQAFAEARRNRRREPFLALEADINMHQSTRCGETAAGFVAMAVDDAQCGLDSDIDRGMEPAQAAECFHEQAVWHAGKVVAVIQATPEGRAVATWLRPDARHPEPDIHQAAAPIRAAAPNARR